MACHIWYFQKEAWQRFIIVRVQTINFLQPWRTVPLSRKFLALNVYQAQTWSNVEPKKKKDPLLKILEKKWSLLWTSSECTWHFLTCYFFTRARSNEIIQVPDLGWIYTIFIVPPQMSSTLQHIFHRWVVISLALVVSQSLLSRQMLWCFTRVSRLETARSGTLNKLIISPVIFQT